MKKEYYDKADLEIVRISTMDVLTASGGGSGDDDDELPFVPVKND